MSEKKILMGDVIIYIYIYIYLNISDSRLSFYCVYILGTRYPAIILEYKMGKLQHIYLKSMF